MENIYKNNADKLMSFKIILMTLSLSLGNIQIASAETPTIQIDVNKTNLLPGETLNVSAIASNGISEIFLTNKESYEEKSIMPFSWSITLPADSSGVFKLIAIAIYDGKQIKSNQIVINIIPDITKLNSLSYKYGASLLLNPGDTSEQIIIGHFNDGYNREITQAVMGTTYSENIINGIATTAGDSHVISVSADGIVTALQPGSAEVVATNNSKTVVRRITVISVEENDADGDGLTDAQEDAIGTNKYHSDSDGDGSTDDIEVGSDVSNPLDADNDGIIDALDNRAVAIKDSSDNYVSMRTSAGKIFSPYGTKISEYPERIGELADIDMQRGLLNFRIEDLTPDQTVDVILDFDSLPANTNKYLKYGPKTPGGLDEWYEFDNFEISGNRITLHLTDNGAGDLNPVAGVITDPGGPGSNGTVPSNGGGGGGCVYNPNSSKTFDPVLLLLLITSGVYLFRRRNGKITKQT